MNIWSAVFVVRYTHTHNALLWQWVVKKRKTTERRCFGSHSPVTGASMSIIVFSDLSSDAPSLTMRNAAASSIRPSRMKCCFSMSGRGLFVLWSHTSAVVSFRPGGNGTPVTGEINQSVVPNNFDTTTAKHRKRYSNY